MSIISLKNPKSQISESYRSVRTNIEFSNIDQNIKTIMITSSQQNEGKSTVVSNLATTFSMLEDKKVLIVDCDLRNPTIHRKFNVSNVEGVSDVLLGYKRVEDCIIKTQENNIHILTTGITPPNPAEMLGSSKMKELIKILKESYDYVFIDTPPIGVVTDAGIVSTWTDGVILVVASKEADTQRVKLAKERLEQLNANILGCILNKYDDKQSAYGYYGSYEKENTKEKMKEAKVRRKTILSPLFNIIDR